MIPLRLGPLRRAKLAISFKWHLLDNGVKTELADELTRILLPEDYVGFPQRRDFPVGGEPVTFTYSEKRYG